MTMNQVTITLPSGEAQTFLECNGFVDTLVVQGVRKDFYLSLQPFLTEECNSCGETKPCQNLKVHGRNWAQCVECSNVSLES